MSRPRGRVGPNRDGLFDPERFTIAERARYSVERLAREANRRASLSPVVRRLQAETDKALGRKRSR